MNTNLLQQVSTLDVNAQIGLVETIWDGIVSRDTVPGLTEPLKRASRRLVDHLANPSDVIPWGEIKASLLSRIKYFK